MKTELSIKGESIIILEEAEKVGRENKGVHLCYTSSCQYFWIFWYLWTREFALLCSFQCSTALYSIVCTELCMHAVREVCCSVILFASSILNSRKLVVAICWCHICLQSHKLYLRVPVYPACREAEMQRRTETKEMKSFRGGMQLMRKYLKPVTSLWLSGPQSIGLMINVCHTVWATAPCCTLSLCVLGIVEEMWSLRAQVAHKTYERLCVHNLKCPIGHDQKQKS